MSSYSIIREVDIVRVENAERKAQKDQVVDERVLKITVNTRFSFYLVCTPTHPKELAAGFLFTRGVISSNNSIERIEFNERTLECDIELDRKHLRLLETSTGNREIRGSSGGMFPFKYGADTPERGQNDVTITPNEVLSLMKQHSENSELFHRTGALHSCGLCSKSDILYYYEDIGRHNALDKMAGDVLLREIPTETTVATVSCRISQEIAEKIVMTGIPVVISNAAPTYTALNTAAEAGLTVIGFARNSRFNIYSHAWRVACLS